MKHDVPSHYERLVAYYTHFADLKILPRAIRINII